MDKSQQKKVNTFLRKYADQYKKHYQDHIILSKADGPEHNKMITEACLWAMRNDIPFFCQLTLKCHVRPDICMPTLPRSVIEVFHTETYADFKKKKLYKYPRDLKESVTTLKSSDVFQGWMLQ